MTYCDECDDDLDQDLALERDGRTLCPFCARDEQDYPFHLEYEEWGDW